MKRKIKWENIVILAIFYIILVLVHLRMGIVSDDSVNLEKFSGHNLSNVISAISHRYSSNGRVFTDAVGFMIYLIPFTLWKFLNPFVYLCIACLIFLMFTPRSSKYMLMICVQILCFPIMDYLMSAGYIMTTVNYIYPTLGLLLVVWPLYKSSEGQKISVLSWIITVFSMIYLCNNDQYAVVLLIGLFLTWIYCAPFRNTDNRGLIKNLILTFTIGIIAYAINFFIPGHIRRMRSTAEYFWLPQYAEWSIWKKIAEGYTTTVANIMFNDITLYAILVTMLAIIGIMQDKAFLRFLGSIPLFILLTVKSIGTDTFVTRYDYSCGMPDLDPNGAGYGLIAVVLSIIAVISIILFIVFALEGTRRMLVLLLLILASISREMMGFSVTIYASSFRTFTFFLFALMIINTLLLKEIDKRAHAS